MGSIINNATFSKGSLRGGYISAGSIAMNNCLSGAGIDLTRVGLLINTGVYTDNYIHEPAYAAMLQGKAQKQRPAGAENTFSFDIHDGSGGVIMAFRILNGFIESGKISFGLVLAGDTCPKEGMVPEAQFANNAGAVLLQKGEPGRGFIRFHRQHFPEHMQEYLSYTKISDGKLKTIVKQSDMFMKNCLSCTHRVITGFLNAEDLKMSDIDVIISSQSPAGFVDELVRIYGKNGTDVVNGEQFHYSAGLIYNLSCARNLGSLKDSCRVLFVSVSGGITINIALYQY